MDMSERGSRHKPNYSKTRFEDSGAPGFEVIRQLDGHCVPTRVPLEDPDLDMDYTANVYDIDKEGW